MKKKKIGSFPFLQSLIFGLKEGSQVILFFFFLIEIDEGNLTSYWNGPIKGRSILTIF